MIEDVLMPQRYSCRQNMWLFNVEGAFTVVMKFRAQNRASELPDMTRWHASERPDWRAIPKTEPEHVATPLLSLLALSKLHCDVSSRRNALDKLYDILMWCGCGTSKALSTTDAAGRCAVVYAIRIAARARDPHLIIRLLNEPVRLAPDSLLFNVFEELASLPKFDHHAYRVFLSLDDSQKAVVTRRLSSVYTAVMHAPLTFAAMWSWMVERERNGKFGQDDIERVVTFTPVILERDAVYWSSILAILAINDNPLPWRVVTQQQSPLLDELLGVTQSDEETAERATVSPLGLILSTTNGTPGRELDARAAWLVPRSSVAHLNQYDPEGHTPLLASVIKKFPATLAALLDRASEIDMLAPVLVATNNIDPVHVVDEPATRSSTRKKLSRLEKRAMLPSLTRASCVESVERIAARCWRWNVDDMTTCVDSWDELRKRLNNATQAQIDAMPAVGVAVKSSLAAVRMPTELIALCHAYARLPVPVNNSSTLNESPRHDPVSRRVSVGAKRKAHCSDTDHTPTDHTPTQINPAAAAIKPDAADHAAATTAAAAAAAVAAVTDEKRTAAFATGAGASAVTETSAAAFAKSVCATAAISATAAAANVTGSGGGLCGPFLAAASDKSTPIDQQSSPKPAAKRARITPAFSAF